MRHDEPPKAASELPPAATEAMQRILGSEYYKSVTALTPLVKGKKVVGSDTGKSGFILFLEHDEWVAAYVQVGCLRWATGTGRPDARQQQLVNSPESGNGQAPLRADRPHAQESNDLRAEVGKAHGRTITGLAIGERSFNFCFPDGLELDATLVNDADGKLALRVFWEQW